MELCRLRSPTIYCPQAGEWGKPVVQFSLSPKAWEPGELMMKVMVTVWRKSEHWCPREGKDRCPSSSKENKFSLPLPFAPLRPSTDGTMPTSTGEGDLLYSIYWFKCSSLVEISSQARPGIMFYWLSGHPFTLPSWHIKLTVTHSKICLLECGRPYQGYIILRVELLDHRVFHSHLHWMKPNCFSNSQLPPPVSEPSGSHWEHLTVQFGQFARCLVVILIYISLTTNQVEHLFICLLDIHSCFLFCEMSDNLACQVLQLGYLFLTDLLFYSKTNSFCYMFGEHLLICNLKKIYLMMSLVNRSFKF